MTRCGPMAPTILSALPLAWRESLHALQPHRPSASSWWALIPGLLTYAAIGAWYIIADTSAWNVGQARLPHA